MHVVGLYGWLSGSLMAPVLCILYYFTYIFQDLTVKLHELLSTKSCGIVKILGIDVDESLIQRAKENLNGQTEQKELSLSKNPLVKNTIPSTVGANPSITDNIAIPNREEVSSEIEPQENARNPLEKEEIPLVLQSKLHNIPQIPLSDGHNGKAEQIYFQTADVMKVDETSEILSEFIELNNSAKAGISRLIDCDGNSQIPPPVTVNKISYKQKFQNKFTEKIILQTNI